MGTTFSKEGPMPWNEVPVNIHLSTCAQVFKSENLITFLRLAYANWDYEMFFMYVIFLVYVCFNFS